jgi:hypothetical protein
MRTSLLIALFAGTAAMAQQPATKTTEQQARSYIASAFITGAAPLILSDDVVVQPELRTKLALPADATSRTIYQALMNLTSGKAVQVRPAIRDEILKSQVLAAPGKPVFALEAGTTTLVMQYDLDRDIVAFVGQPAAITTAAPVATSEAPQKSAETPAPQAQAPAQPPGQSAPEAAPAAAPAPFAAPVLEPASASASVATPAPTPAPEPVAAPAAAPAPVPAPAAAAAETHKPGLQIVEPQEPRSKPVAAPVAKAPAAPAAATVARAREARPPLPKPNGPCVIRPVMSDQDLVNCGATPHY